MENHIMQKVTFALIWLLFGLTILFPAGTLIAFCFGYTFELKNTLAFAGIIALISVCTVVLHLVFKNANENKAAQILLTVITPLSLLNAVLLIFDCPQIWAIANVLISVGCCVGLTAKYGKPLKLKKLVLSLSAFMILPLGYFSFIAAIFGNIGQDTIVKTAGSPSGKYCAQVISSDQGALGGDTFVDVYDVYEGRGIDTVLFKIEKKPQRVYSGDWGEFERMQIYWKDDGCLVINSIEHIIE